MQQTYTIIITTIPWIMQATLEHESNLTYTMEFCTNNNYSTFNDFVLIALVQKSSV